ncbi:MAG: hypothetical protein FWC11_00455 [Firmicutes bacterium]|nr:hypothetical protein [Bacillota bacterium]
MKKEICKKCEYYSAYYQKHIYSFERLKYGVCSFHKKPIKEFDECENFKCHEKREKRKDSFLLIQLEHCLFDIHNISQILTENFHDSQ